jgi:hypothetical protein
MPNFRALKSGLRPEKLLGEFARVRTVALNRVAP